MASRRYGQNRSGRPHLGGPMNPWEGNNMPGGSSRGGMMNQTNMLNQLSEPQAQLAIALSKLLQPQQAQSLLSMDTGGHNMYNDYSGRGRLNYNRDRPLGYKTYGRNREVDYTRRYNVKSRKPQGKYTTNKTTSKSSEKKTSENIEDEDKEATKTADDKEDPATENEEGDDTVSKDEETKEENGESTEEKMDVDKDDKDNKNKLKKKKGAKYEGIPAHLLKCRICQKGMWDGKSFEKHMKGKAHQQMFEKVDESYQIKANMMRESIRLMEEKNSIEIERIRRLGKKTKVPKGLHIKSYCNMCDLHFYGYLMAHRKSASHQKLKQFLHPHCDYCLKEFPNRMEWELHRHTAEHFRNKAKGYDKEREKQIKDDIILEETLDVVSDDLADISEDTDIVTDVPEDLEDVNNKIPLYSSKRSVGSSLITEVTGYFCQPCGRFFLDKEKSEVHTRSELHYETFVKILNDKITEMEEKKRKSKEENADENDRNSKKLKPTTEEETSEEQNEEENEDKKWKDIDKEINNTIKDLEKSNIEENVNQ